MLWSWIDILGLFVDDKKEQYTHTINLLSIELVRPVVTLESVNQSFVMASTLYQPTVGAVRQPFAPLNSSRLQTLTSLKNRQNGNSLSPRPLLSAFTASNTPKPSPNLSPRPQNARQPPTTMTSTPRTSTPPFPPNAPKAASPRSPNPPPSSSPKPHSNSPPPRPSHAQR